jgi:hypothetical protein
MRYTHQPRVSDEVGTPWVTSRKVAVTP